jgi:hypothetical protein
LLWTRLQQPDSHFLLPLPANSARTAAYGRRLHKSDKKSKFLSAVDLPANPRVKKESLPTKGT